MVLGFRVDSTLLIALLIDGHFQRMKIMLLGGAHFFVTSPTMLVGICEGDAMSALSIDELTGHMGL